MPFSPLSDGQEIPTQQWNWVFQNFVNLVENNGIIVDLANYNQVFDVIIKIIQLNIVPQSIGNIDHLPFAESELSIYAKGWEVADGRSFEITTEQGVVLNNFSQTYKTAWEITTSSVGGVTSITSPNLFIKAGDEAGDRNIGQGYFLRAGRNVGNKVLNALPNIVDEISTAGVANITGKSLAIFQAGTNDKKDSNGTQFYDTMGINLGLKEAIYQDNITEVRPAYKEFTPCWFSGVI